MREWNCLTSIEIAALDRRLPLIIPVGLVEAHGAHLPVSVDVATAEYFSRKIAENTGAILMPGITFGFADEMAGYPGTLGVRAETLMAVVEDLSSALCQQGFSRQIFLSGHGANKPVVELAFWKIWKKHPELRAVCWNYWTEAGLTTIHHADKGETEIAIAVGLPAQMEKAQTFHVKKPWYKIRSRSELDPLSGGVNGDPTQASAEEGAQMRDQVIRILSEKVSKVIAAELSPL
ncbi:MAG: creatininase family protein [Verrucomicrobiota bacterium]